METIVSAENGAAGLCVRCPLILVNPEALPPEVGTGFDQHQLGCLHYQGNLTAKGARFRQDRVLRVAGLALNPFAGAVQRENQTLELTHHEYRLLELLMAHPNQTCSYEMILQQIWG